MAGGKAQRSIMHVIVVAQRRMPEYRTVQHTMCLWTEVRQKRVSTLRMPGKSLQRKLNRPAL